MNPVSPPFLIRLRAFALNGILLACTLLLLFLAGEVLLRVLRIELMGTPLVSIHRPSAIEGLVYELVPGVSRRGFGWEHITVNSQGFRSPEREPGKPLIAVIGDSYVFGHGVNDDETDPAYLQEEFPEYFVLNAGVDGYNIEQEALVMQHRIAPLRPSIVILEFVFNDMIPKGIVKDDGTIDVGVGTKEERDKTLQEAVTRKGLINFPGKFFLEEHSAVFNFIERKTKWLPFRTRVVDERDTVTPEQLAFYEQWFSVFDDAVETDSKIFVIWPESNWHSASRAFLRSLAERHGYAVLDLYDTLGNGYLHLGWDYHPRASVHRDVAKKIAALIRTY